MTRDTERERKEERGTEREWKGERETEIEITGIEREGERK